MDTEAIKDLKKAGEIAKEVKKFARGIVKPGVPLVEIADKIEGKIVELGGLPAFPTNLSVNEVAAHATPAHNSDEVAEGLLKIDLGVHINGRVADTAFSVDLDNSEENKKLIETAEKALEKAADVVKLGVGLSEIGKEIEGVIKAVGFQPIVNLSGHSIDDFDLHSGVTIPNVDNGSSEEISEGVYAVEPFVTLSSGSGSVRDGKPSGIYQLESEGQVRDPFAREVLQYIREEYQTLPFCSRWLVKKFGTRALIAMKRIEEASLVHHYKQLVEKSGAKVAQAEHTLIITGKEKIITT